MIDNKDYTISDKISINNLNLVQKLDKYANDIDFGLSGLREYGYNENYGNVFLYTEYEIFSLFITDYDAREEVKACYYDFNDGEELILDSHEIEEIFSANKNAQSKTLALMEYFNEWQEQKDKGNKVDN